MNPDEIYTKIIAKGILGGWIPRQDMGENFTWLVQNGNFLCKSMVWSESKGSMEEFIVGCNVEKVIFDHAFACALWGDKDTELDLKNGENAVIANHPQYIWELAHLAMSEDRVAYLEPFSKIV